MIIKLPLPNGYGSEEDYEQCSKESCGELDSLNAPLRDAAVLAGLTYVCASDHSAYWVGTPEEVSVCKSALPSWALPYATVIEDYEQIPARARESYALGVVGEIVENLLR